MKKHEKRVAKTPRRPEGKIHFHYLKATLKNTNLENSRR